MRYGLRFCLGQQRVLQRQKLRIPQPLIRQKSVQAFPHHPVHGGILLLQFLQKTHKAIHLHQLQSGRHFRRTLIALQPLIGKMFGYRRIALGHHLPLRLLRSGEDVLKRGGSIRIKPYRLLHDSPGLGVVAQINRQACLPCQQILERIFSQHRVIRCHPTQIH